MLSKYFRDLFKKGSRFVLLGVLLLVARAYPANAAAAPPLWVADTLGNCIVIIDTATNQVMQRIYGVTAPTSIKFVNYAIAYVLSPSTASLATVNAYS